MYYCWCTSSSCEESGEEINMQDKKVSIIIPLYNVADYVGECIESLIRQTYQNLEIIIVDDDSSDNSLEICNAASKKDSRIKVVHKENGGAASARNRALDLRTGEYTCFVDSDDYVEEDYIERLVYVLETTEADVAVCSFTYLYKNSTLNKGYNGPQIEMTQIEYLQRFLSDWTCGLIWNKIFKTEVVGKIRFPEGHKIDDEFFTYRLIMNCKKVTMFSDALYNYRMRASSVMKESDSYRERILMDRIQYLQERYDNVVERYPELKKVYTIGLIDSLIRYHRESLEIPATKNYIKLVIKKYTKIIIFTKIGWKNKYIFVRGIISKARENKQEVEENKYQLFD